MIILYVRMNSELLLMAPLMFTVSMPYKRHGSIDRFAKNFTFNIKIV